MTSCTIQTIWKTASEQCEVVFGPLIGYRVRLWVQGRLLIDDLRADARDAVHRAWELRLEWPACVD